MQTISKQILAIMLLWATFISAATHAVDDEIEAFSPQELQQLLAPVALYPDTVLTHVLIASTYPLEVVRADRWRQGNLELESEAAVNAGEDKGWDPSVSALLAFPDLLTRMSEDLDWTQRLGEAFLYSEADVLSAIQALRQQAYDNGNLEDLEHLDVSSEDGNIIIAPVKREVVYVPYYDSRMVYGSWLWPSYPPAYWSHSYASHYNHRGFYWGIYAPVHYGFYFGGFHWGHRNVVVIHNHRTHRNRRYYSGRQLVTHHNASRWQHQPSHRRGVRYRDTRVHRSWNTSRHAAVRTRRDAAEGRQVHRNTQRQVRTTRSSDRSSEYNTTRRESLQQRMSGGKKHNGPRWRAGSPPRDTATQDRPSRERAVTVQQQNRSEVTERSRSQQVTPRRDPVVNNRVQRQSTNNTRTTQPTTRTTTRSTTRSISRPSSRPAPTRSRSRG